VAYYIAMAGGDSSYFATISRNRPLIFEIIAAMPRQWRELVVF
jgi:hypothetical protein